MGAGPITPKLTGIRFDCIPGLAGGVRLRNATCWLVLAAALAGCQSNAASRQPGALARRELPAPVNASPPFPILEAAKERPKAAAAEGKVRLVSDDDEATPDPQPGALLPAAGPAVLSLDQAIETGLADNPDLAALRQNEGVSAAALGVAQTYPINPWVQYRATPIQRDVQGKNGPMYNYVLLIQQIQLGHQQQFREEMAASQLNQVRWTIHNFELLNVAQTARLYFTALYQRGIRDLARASADLNQQLLTISEQQLNAGQISNADLAIIRIDARSTRQQAELAEANYRTALLDLRRQMNLPLETPIELSEDLMQYQWRPVRDAALGQIGSSADALLAAPPRDGELVRRLADGRPDVMAAHADIETAGANLRLANGSRIPDLQIGPFIQHDDFGTMFYGFQGQMDIPVMNNGKPLVRQRVAEHQQRNVTWQNLQTRAELEAVAAADRYERARKLVEAARPEHTEDLPAELQALEKQFQANEIDVLRIFQGRTSLIQNRRAMLDTLNELAQATAALTAASGLPPIALVSEPARQP